MNELKVFNSPEFGQVRTFDKDGEPWFVGKDVAIILGYERTADAIRAHVDEDDKGVGEIQTPGGKQKIVIINESGLYSLVLSSKLPTAKKFKHWITSEVLPAIRKTGGYIANAETMTDAEIMSKALLIAKQTIESREQRIHSLEAETERMKPKEIFADAVSASNSSILIGDLAKILHGNGIKIGRGRLFAWMREHGFLIKQKGTSYNMPTQRAMELGLFRVKEGSYVDGKGNNIITKTTKVTGKGQQYFINKFLAEKS
ncbi:phage antirepressor KilAC domain-containing protein [Megasphaera sp. CLA-AA-H81]|jgi:anti-repressor protein|uniref:Phage antirepressor KilAC domain-containing protein n=1 Tax=Megasphaera intestinihominis TaxID=3133159 RepID=A0ABV1CXW5_9FIRM